MVLVAQSKQNYESSFTQKTPDQSSKSSNYARLQDFFKSAAKSIYHSIEPVLQDFKPVKDKKWKPETGKNVRVWKNSQIPVFMIDRTTGKKYWNESKNCVGAKCFALALGTLFIQPVLSVIPIAYRIVKFVSFAHFWIPKQDEKSYSFKERSKDVGKDLLRVVAAPIAIIALELAAIYGVFSPYNGRKLYGSIEKNMFEDKHLLAPCFQSDPMSHFFNGNPEERDAW